MRGWRALSAIFATVAVLVAAAGPGFADTQPGAGSTAGEDTATLNPGTVVPDQNDELESQLLLRDQAFISGRLAGSAPLSVDQAVALRKAAADQAKLLKNPPPAGPPTFTADWAPLGPNPIVQVQRSNNTFAAQSGRIGALAPSDDNVVYAGTGEGALSGDSYFGHGILKSTDGGVTWNNVSGDFFFGVSTSRLAVDPND